MKDSSSHPIARQLSVASAFPCRLVGRAYCSRLASKSRCGGVTVTVVLCLRAAGGCACLPDCHNAWTAGTFAFGKKKEMEISMSRWMNRPLFISKDGRCFRFSFIDMLFEVFCQANDGSKRYPSTMNNVHVFEDRHTMNTIFSTNAGVPVALTLLIKLSTSHEENDNFVQKENR